MHYTPPAIRPFQAAEHVMLEVTTGCTHNRCKFCSYYRNVPFRMAPLSQIEEDLQEVSRFKPDAEHVYALGGDPFTLAVPKLKDIGELIKRYLPKADFGTYARITSIMPKSVDELKELRAIGWSDLYIGIESGDDEALSIMNKGYTSEDIVRECSKLDKAGINYHYILIDGLAGHGNCERNAKNTAAVINKLHPVYISLSSLMVVPGTELYDMMQAGEFTEATELERLQEVLCLIKELRVPVTIDARSEANFVNFVARLPEDRDTLVRELEKVIANFSAEDERKLHLYRTAMSRMG